MATSLYKDILFSLTPDTVDTCYNAADALALLARRFQTVSRSVSNAQKQLLKFDEINRLTAPKEETVKTGSASAKQSTPKTSASKSTTAKTPAVTTPSTSYPRIDISRFFSTPSASDAPTVIRNSGTDIAALRDAAKRLSSVTDDLSGPAQSAGSGLSSLRSAARGLVEAATAQKNAADAFSGHVGKFGELSGHAGKFDESLSLDAATPIILRPESGVDTAPVEQAVDEAMDGLTYDQALRFSVRDVLFNWGDWNEEKVFMRLLTGLSAVTDGFFGSQVAGALHPPLFLDEYLRFGVGAGIAFGVDMNASIFNFDGEIQPEEIQKSVLAYLPPIIGGAAGLIGFGPLGGAVGLFLGTILSVKLLKTEDGEFWQSVNGWFENAVSSVKESFSSLTSSVGEFATRAKESLSTAWSSIRETLRTAWEGVRSWWTNLTLGPFTFRLPHLRVDWQELQENSILSRVLGIDAIPHLSVDWYARGGIVRGATLIGAGEQGSEAIVPLERHTEWIHKVALELKEELESLSPSTPLILPDLARGAVTPPAALQLESSAAPDLSGLAETFARALAELGEQLRREDAEVRVYLDGRQLTEAVTKYQRRSSRALG